VRSNAGYEENAAALIPRYEAIPFEEVYGRLLDFVPERPGRALDIGAGTGRDAAALAARGWDVVAAEPTAAFRAAAKRSHGDATVQWIDDALPELAAVRALGETFDLIAMIAVFMHLDADERPRAMDRIADLAAPGARLLLVLRHGEVPEGRRIFPISADETARLAEARGFACLFAEETSALQKENRAAGVTFTRMAFRRG